MKKLLLILPLALILCFMVGCQDKEAMTELKEFRAQAEVEKKNMEIVYLEAEKVWNEGKLEIVDEVYAPQKTSHIGGVTSTYTPDETKELVSTWLEAFPDFKFKIEDIIAEGNKVAVRYTFTGTHQGKILGIAPTGKKITVSQMCFIRFENGKIAEVWEDFDALGMYQQLGMELKPKEEKKKGGGEVSVKVCHYKLSFLN